MIKENRPMSKKIWYSQPLAIIWDAYNKSNRTGNISPKEFVLKWLAPQIMNPFIPDGTPIQTNILIGDLFYADAEKQLLHLYFVDKYLRDFLMDLPIADFDGIAKFIVENGFKMEGGVLTTFGHVLKTRTMLTNYDFGIHIPYENKLKGYAFSFNLKPEDGKLVFSWIVEKDAGYLTLDRCKELRNDKSERAKKVFSYFKLAINTIAYMNTFPECIQDGVPNQVKDIYSKKLVVSEKILESSVENSTKKQRTPHFRRGYFKRLNSDFYTRKKGQLVFVKETMVNGIAKTVYTASNLDDISSECT